MDEQTSLKWLSFDFLDLLEAQSGRHDDCALAVLGPLVQTFIRLPGLISFAISGVRLAALLRERLLQVL